MPGGLLRQAEVLKEAPGFVADVHNRIGLDLGRSICASRSRGVACPVVVLSRPHPLDFARAGNGGLDWGVDASHDVHWGCTQVGWKIATAFVGEGIMRSSGFKV